MSGRVKIEFIDASGAVFKTINKNRIVAGGLKWVVGRMLNATAGVIPSHIAIGDSTVATTNGDTALGRERARVAISLTALGDVAAAPFAEYTALFDVGTGTGDVTELGLFLSSAVMVARTVIPSQTKSSTTSIRVTWTITLKSA